MLNSHKFAAALIGAAGVMIIPAQAQTLVPAERVTFEINLEAPTAEIYRDIKDQARQACTPERVSASVAVRVNLRRSCQRDLVREVIKNLQLPRLTAYAANPKQPVQMQ